MTILEELYNGNINPSEKFIKKDSEYRSLMNEYAEQIDKLTAILDNGEKELFEKIMETGVSIGYISDKENFIGGFCLGARIMIEIPNRDPTDRSVL